MDETEHDRRIVLDDELDNSRDYPKYLRCSDGAEICETAKNWERYMKNPDGFQDEYIQRVKRWLGRL